MRARKRDVCKKFYPQQKSTQITNHGLEARHRVRPLRKRGFKGRGARLRCYFFHALVDCQLEVYEDK